MSGAQARVSQLKNQLGVFGSGVGPGQLLKGEVTIITGAGNGIGKMAAIIAGAHGAHVVVSDLDPQKTQETVDTIKNNGGSAIGVPGDVTAKDFGETVVKATIDAYGKINHIVNNAGFTADKMLHTMSDDIWNLILDVHCTAPFRIVRAAAPHLRLKDPEKHENRCIINISSTSGIHGNAGQINYSAAKAAVTGMTKTICKELGPFNVRCNCIAYGSIDTRLTQAKEDGASITVIGQKIALGIPASMRANPQANNDVPLRRQGNAEEAAAAIVMLLSPLSSYISGHTLEVTGGRGI
ncbi:NAD(P)-binding protein [Tilletiaria anomala UBC 951]|uniref:NAD(P)-binding protein n=1 Tax=Tilletiaria anomala (strain ATCC 24038 / CBS 436.72 / UBC 951) TaxID=1037660 RepID=A0A066VFJ9_TILAU|nr:NAD(P)-binding protein [Tilletiaria anomala UBC 951]KDN40512.1 NAD(P)-binding protein [Tilletiaria anomala UBC 951]